MRCLMFIKRIYISMFAEEPFFTNCFTKMCYNLVKGFSCCTTIQQGPNNTSLTGEVQDLIQSK